MLYNNYNKMTSQPYMPSIGAPSSIPKHLHFVRDPLKHNIVALKIANDNRARIHPIIINKLL